LEDGHTLSLPLPPAGEGGVGVPPQTALIEGMNPHPPRSGAQLRAERVDLPRKRER